MSKDKPSTDETPFRKRGVQPKTAGEGMRAGWAAIWNAVATGEDLDEMPIRRIDLQDPPQAGNGDAQTDEGDPKRADR